MTFYKAGASKQTAPSRGPGSFPTPVRGKGRCAEEASFKGGGDEEAVCIEENNKESMLERRENNNGTKPQFLGKLMETALSSLYRGWDFNEGAVGLGEGRRGSGEQFIFLQPFTASLYHR